MIKASERYGDDKTQFDRPSCIKTTRVFQGYQYGYIVCNPGPQKKTGEDVNTNMQ